MKWSKDHEDNDTYTRKIRSGQTCRLMLTCTSPLYTSGIAAWRRAGRVPGAQHPRRVRPSQCARTPPQLQLGRWQRVAQEHPGSSAPAAAPGANRRQSGRAGFGRRESCGAGAEGAQHCCMCLFSVVLFILPLFQPLLAWCSVLVSATRCSPPRAFGEKSAVRACAYVKPCTDGSPLCPVHHR